MEKNSVIFTVICLIIIGVGIYFLMEKIEKNNIENINIVDNMEGIEENSTIENYENKDENLNDTNIFTEFNEL